MPQFYNRYVPPSKKPPRQHNTEVAPVEKRKRLQNITDDQNDSNKQSKRRKVVEQQQDESSYHETERNERRNRERHHTVNGGGTGKHILDKYSISTFATSLDGEVDITPRKRPGKKNSSDVEEDMTQNTLQPESITPSVGQATPGEADEVKSNKYSRVLRKYDKSKKASNSVERARQDGESVDAESAVPELRGLVPIPQPQISNIEARIPIYSTLASWQENAERIEPTATISFKELGLSDKMLSNLKSHGIEEAFPVQSTIIPLLTGRNHSHLGDICISAATGSGKTLAYVVPIVERLRQSKRSGLRAVIVVPTRELVKQVRETCEMCASGTDLKIVSALGSKALHEEQKALVEEEEAYNPEAYQRELNMPLDWSAFSLETTLQKARKKDPAKVINYITKTRLKADILITTPGRLVDHLQNTDGFTLDHVEWLVVDEADRLLNESYQEWIDVVVPALQSRTATEERDTILSYMRMELPPRIVKKILLSATMTRDISKLNHVGLHNPMLIVLDSLKSRANQIPITETEINTEEPATNAAGKYALPGQLQEFAVTLKEGAHKPLLVLQLLERHVNIPTTIERQDQMVGEDEQEEEAGSVTSVGSDAASVSVSGTSDSDSEDLSDSSSSSSDGSERRKKQANFLKLQHQNLRLSKPRPNVRCLIFTRSTAAASRLSRLLSIISPSLASRITTLTRSTASSASSRKALSSFRSGITPILIATDRASRGIDVPGLEHVISYDIPGSALTYIHRVGRTARAGKEGNAWTMVEYREGRWFWNEIGGKSDDCMIHRSQKVKKMNLSVDDEELEKRYEDALQKLGSEVRGERD